MKRSPKAGVGLNGQQTKAVAHTLEKRTNLNSSNTYTWENHRNDSFAAKSIPWVLPSPPEIHSIGRSLIKRGVAADAVANSFSSRIQPSVRFQEPIRFSQLTLRWIWWGWLVLLNSYSMACNFSEFHSKGWRDCSLSIIVYQTSLLYAYVWN